MQNLEAMLQACLFACGDPVELDRLIAVTGATELEVVTALETLREQFDRPESGIALKRLERSYQFVTKAEYAPQVKELLELRRNTALSRSALEVLAIIAYNQPVTKSLIEQIRGVDSYYILNSLCEKGLIEEAQRLPIPGRPITYVTTPHFLRCFSLETLDQLIPVDQLDVAQHEEVQE